ncbi:MAG: Xaa-Pro peptidase family protein [Armatimonadetes bacterium]|nr:Xaa-Pro peptidase family protein [Armatimonadota bacterium]MDW8027891.1 Xaa-Pro peptidase family protein [Armatimonadota bacterium]
MQLAQRLEKVRAKLSERKLPALIVFSRTNIRYLTGFTGSAGVLIIGQDGWAWLITDGRYKLQSKEQTRGTSVKVAITRLTDKVIANRLKKMKVKHVGFEGRYCTVAFLDKLREQLKGTKIRLESVDGIVEELRAVKEESELAQIRSAAQLADKAFEYALKVIRPEMTEKELAWEIEAFLRTHGADAIAFPPIVISGERTALPHGQPSDRKLRKGDLITIDIGAISNGYCSDLTRTIVLGKPNGEQQKLYSVVWEAQRRGIEALTSNQKGKKVDSIVREVFDKHGLKKLFMHGTGHGVGLEIHEAPSLGQRSKDVLRPNMVVTVEPGVYVPNLGGVRIEDMFLVTDGKPEVLTNAPNPKKILSV